MEAGRVDAWLLLPALVVVSLVALAVFPFCYERIAPSPGPPGGNASSESELVPLLALDVFSAVVTALFGARLIGWPGRARFLGSVLVSATAPIALSPSLIILWLVAAPAAGWALGAVIGRLVCHLLGSTRSRGVSLAISEAIGRPPSSEDGGTEEIRSTNCWLKWAGAGFGGTVFSMVGALVAVRAGTLNLETLAGYGAVACVAWIQAVAVIVVFTFRRTQT